MTTEEWLQGIQILTEMGANATQLGNEFIMLSDIFGVSSLVDIMNNPPVKNTTESCVEGPAFMPDAPDRTLRLNLVTLLFRGSGTVTHAPLSALTSAQRRVHH